MSAPSSTLLVPPALWASAAAFSADLGAAGVALARAGAEGPPGAHRAGDGPVLMLATTTTALHHAFAQGLCACGVLVGEACRDGASPVPPEYPLVSSLDLVVNLMVNTVRDWHQHQGGLADAAVVAVGGPSRSGKTLCATALALALRQQGRRVMRLSLDRFIAPASARRPGMALRERLGSARAREAVLALLSGRPVQLPSYDPATREAGPPLEARRSAQEVLVVDGLLAAEADWLGARAVTVALDAPDDLLLQRRAAFYRWKGLTGEAYDAAVHGGSLEPSLVRRAGAAAGLHLALSPTSLRLRERAPGATATRSVPE